MFHMTFPILPYVEVFSDTKCEKYCLCYYIEERVKFNSFFILNGTCMIQITENGVYSSPEGGINLGRNQLGTESTWDARQKRLLSETKTLPVSVSLI
jgi:hypothetical protein